MALQNLKTTTRLKVITAFSMLGFGVQTDLAREFYQIRAGLALYDECHLVLSHRYLTLPGNIPISSLGGVFLAACAGLALLARLKSAQQDCIRGLVPLGFAGVVLATFQLIVAIWILQRFCLWNLLSSLLILSVGILSGWGLRHEFKRGSGKTATIVISACLIVIPAWGAFEAPQKPSPVSGQVYVQNFLTQKPFIEIPTPQPGPTLGLAQAPIQVVVFFDFQCGESKKSARLLDALYHRFYGQIQITLRNFPKDGHCNPLVPPGGGNTAACEAAFAAHCAGQQGKYYAAYQTFFDRQSELKTGHAKELLTSLELDAKLFDQCMNDPATAQVVQKDIQDGLSYSVDRTPIIYVNRHPTAGLYPLEVWELLARTLIEKTNP